ncbi:uncharacterized protein LOC120674718 [Panicum virgatum]|uniref:uncharacterized protein LOC120674718 n=1 Tax=Panicum virgatum TaxID=38727 RepID=UPI0019D58B23|nr:uncharacterized protein LOC120674718 [Panicum virgatum]
MHGGKTTQEPPSPQDAEKQRKTVTASHTEVEDKVQEEAVKSNTSATQEDPVEPPRTSQDYHDTTTLPFSERIRKPVADEQFGKFVEVPTYAKYIKDILGNKRTLLTTEVVQLTEECSAAILYPLLVKKKDPGCPTITCSIGAQHFSNALCDLGARLVVQTVRYPAGIAENISVKIWNFFIPVDFIVLDMEVDTKTPLILGRPFLSTANAHIDVEAGEIQLNINGQKEKFAFKSKVEQ